MAAFVAEHGPSIDADRAWEIICEATPDDSWLNLFECIFSEGARFAMHHLENHDLLRENAQYPAAGSNTQDNE